MNEDLANIEVCQMRSDIARRRVFAHEAWKQTLAVVEAAGSVQQVAEMHRRATPKHCWTAKLGGKQ